MSRAEKSNAAWRLVAQELVVGGKPLTIQQTATLGDTSLATVKTMRSQRRKIIAAGEDPRSMKCVRPLIAPRTFSVLC